MGLEIVLALVIPVAQKVGEKWIDRVATGIADFPIQLFKEAVYDPEKEQEAEDYLRDNPDVGERVGQNVASAMQSGDIAASIAAAVVPSSGEILRYYSELINWIVQYGSRLGRQFALKGFLNGELCLSYFIFDPSTEKTDIVHVEDSDNFVRCPTGIAKSDGIYVEQMRSAKARDEKFEAINRKARLSSRGKLTYDQYSYNSQVWKIYQHYVWYEEYGYQDPSDLSSKKQDQIEITTTYASVSVMLHSLWELFEYQNAFVEDLQRGIEGITRTSID